MKLVESAEKNEIFQGKSVWEIPGTVLTNEQIIAGNRNGGAKCSQVAEAS